MILVPTLERFKIEFLAKKEEERRLHKLLDRCETGVFRLKALEKVPEDDYQLLEVQQMLKKARKDTDEIQNFLPKLWTQFKLEHQNIQQSVALKSDATFDTTDDGDDENLRRLNELLALPASSAIPPAVTFHLNCNQDASTVGSLSQSVNATRSFDTSIVQGMNVDDKTKNVLLDTNNDVRNDNPHLPPKPNTLTTTT